jgi:hypothetical protein
MEGNWSPLFFQKNGRGELKLNSCWHKIIVINIKSLKSVTKNMEGAIIARKKDDKRYLYWKVSRSLHLRLFLLFFNHLFIRLNVEFYSIQFFAEIRSNIQPLFFLLVNLETDSLGTHMWPLLCLIIWYII